MKRPHPSGKPIRRDERKGLSIYRPPGEGPITPSMKRQQFTQAVGFMAPRDWLEEESEMRYFGEIPL